MDLSGALLAGITACYSAPAFVAIARGNYGRAIVVFFVPMLPLFAESVIPLWLLWVVFLALWIGLAIWAVKDDEKDTAKEVSVADGKGNFKDKLEMIKWLSLIPLLIMFVFGLIFFSRS